jgi:hypothetical protein
VDTVQDEDDRVQEADEYKVEEEITSNDNNINHMQKEI